MARSYQQTILADLIATAGAVSNTFTIPIPRGVMSAITLSIACWDGASKKGFVKIDLTAQNVNGVVTQSAALTNLLLSGIVDAALSGVACIISTTTDAIVVTCSGISSANPLTWGMQAVFRVMIQP